MRILITGASGFVGQHLADHLHNTYPDAEIHGTTPLGLEVDRVGVVWHSIDLRDEPGVSNLVESINPVQIYHLAAQAFVPHSFEDPWETLENNIRAQLYITLACIKHNLKPRILVVGSAEIYGIVQPDELPLTEQGALRPTSPYSVSKIAQDMLALQYYVSHDLPIMRTRSFNHIGPGQNDRFVTPSFALQIARIEAGQQEPKIKVGELNTERDFTDVRDIVRAYQMIVEQGTPGEAYNVASGKAYSIRELLNILLSFSEVDIQIRLDTQRLRPTSVPTLLGSYDKLKQATGWQPLIPFKETLHDVLNDCRQRIQHIQNKDLL